MDQAGNVIDVRHLSRQYEYHRKEPGVRGSILGLFRRETIVTQAVKDISFSLREGELVGFLGPNGAGKTTTLKILSGILHPTSGEVRVLGHVPFRRHSGFQKQFALVMGQKNQLWWDLPARETFLLNKEIYEVPDAEYRRNLDELAALLDIRDIISVPVRTLSLGQRMKCELVAALVHRPRVLLLDEPTIGLDVLAQKNIRDFIRQYNREQRTTILLTSHYMEDISSLCERVIVISAGSIVFDGRLDDLVRRYAHDKLITVISEGAGIRQEDMSAYGPVARYMPNRIVLRIPRDQAKLTAARILSSGLPVEDILISEIEIDDVVRTIFSAP